MDEDHRAPDAQDQLPQCQRQALTPSDVIVVTDHAATLGAAIIVTEDVDAAKTMIAEEIDHAALQHRGPLLLAIVLVHATAHRSERNTTVLPCHTSPNPRHEECLSQPTLPQTVYVTSQK